MDKKSLEQEIFQQEQNLANIEKILNGESSKGVRKEWLNINEALVKLRKALALVTGEEKVIKYQPEVRIGLVNQDVSPEGLIWDPAPYIEGPVIFQTYGSIILVFDVTCLKDDGLYDDCLNERLSTNRLLAVVQAEGYLASKFGFPGAEEIDANPLSEKGLMGYGVFEVINSLWEKRFQEKRLTTWWHNVRLASIPNITYPSKRHFVISFKECCFECLADELSIILTEETDEQIRQFIVKQMTIPFIMNEDEINHLLCSDDESLEN